MGLIPEAQIRIRAAVYEVDKSVQNGIIKADDIGNYWPKLRLRQLNTIYRWLYDLPTGTLEAMGFCLSDGELSLEPIDVEIYFGLLGSGIPRFLLHDGFERYDHVFESQEVKDYIPSFDNRIGMQQRGVWGNPDKRMATFVKPPDSRIVPMARNGLGTRLYIDIQKLKKTRNIYVDPEMYIPNRVKDFDGAEYDIPGNSLMVFGGIPRGAIANLKKINIREL